MQNILIINHKIESCGVYQYAKRVASIFKKSKIYNIIYLELDNKNDLINYVNEFKPKTIIYNYLDGTMPWLSSEEIDYIRQLNIPQGLIVHNINYSNKFDYYLHQNPDFIENENNYAILRPLFDYKNINKSKLSEIPKIGTFGFGFKVKKYEDICTLINEQFDKAEIRMHLTLSHFCPNYHELEEIKQACYSRITKPDIKLKFTSDFIDDEGVLNFLESNDLNIFLYQYYQEYNGISSVIDYALSVKKPIAVCKSSMFSHITNTNPSICVEEITIPNILNNGITPLNNFYEKWNNENFINHLEKIIKKIII